jgi:hypothetical protein
MNEEQRDSPDRPMVARFELKDPGSAVAQRKLPMVCKPRMVLPKSHLQSTSFTSDMIRLRLARNVETSDSEYWLLGEIHGCRSGNAAPKTWLDLLPISTESSLIVLKRAVPQLSVKRQSPG